MGNLSNQHVRNYVTSCDLVLDFGPHHSDTNSFQYSSITDPDVTISFKATQVQAGSTILWDLPARQFLCQLLERIDKTKIALVTHDCPVRHTSDEIGSSPAKSELVMQCHFWKSMSAFLKPGYIGLSETGTLAHGSRELILPRNTRYFSAVAWLAVGYMLPAALGASIAERKPRENIDGHPCGRASDSPVRWRR
jgi:pyruvate decarboxylase